MRWSNKLVAPLLLLCLVAATAGCTSRSYIAWMIRGTSRNVTKDQSVCGELARINRWRATRDLAVMEILAIKGSNKRRLGHVYLCDLGKSQNPASREFFKTLGCQPTIFDNGMFTYRAARIPKGTVFEIEKIIAIDAYNIQHYAYARILPTMRRVGVEDLFFKNPHGPGPWGSVSPNPDCIEPQTSPSL